MSKEIKLESLEDSLSELAIENLEYNDRCKKVRKIIKEMFSQRGYTDIKKENNKDISALKNTGEKIYAFTNILKKLNVSEIRKCISEIQKIKVNHAILVFEGIPTSAVKNVISNIPQININIELFQADDLQFNITKHVLVPVHQVLTKEESKNFKEKFGTNIPVLLKSDPICKFYDFHKGDIIKIIRKTGYICYRIVR